MRYLIGSKKICWTMKHRDVNDYFPLFKTFVSPDHIVLVNVPTHHRRILSMAITNSCATGREMLRTSKQPFSSLIYVIASGFLFQYTIFLSIYLSIYVIGFSSPKSARYFA